MLGRGALLLREIKKGLSLKSTYRQHVEAKTEQSFKYQAHTFLKCKYFLTSCMYVVSPKKKCRKAFEKASVEKLENSEKKSTHARCEHLRTSQFLRYRHDLLFYYFFLFHRN